MIVVDTSVIASLWVPNDMEDLAYQVLRKDPDWVAPLLWRSEIRNVLALYLRKNILERSEEHTSELQSRGHLVCRLLLEKKNIINQESPVVCNITNHYLDTSIM